MGKQSLVALDTNHIKQYVFATDRLKEIRGASSILDYLNRIVMKELAWIDGFDERRIIYANGGSGLFLIEAERADDFGKSVQKACNELTGYSASVTYIVQELPPDAPQEIDRLLKYPLAETLSLMRYRLRTQKDIPLDSPDLPSHSFMRICDACGIRYACPDLDGEEKSDVERDVDEENNLYCISCQLKRKRDSRVRKEYIPLIEARQPAPDEYLWDYLIKNLRAEKYNIPPRTDRPHDFNVFRNFKGAKEYLGLIYADANGMGSKVEACETLVGLHELAEKIDKAIYKAVSFAIAQHLMVNEHIRTSDELVDVPKYPLFPFDILLLGGDDVVMVVPASSALEVAISIAQKFYEEANKHDDVGVGTQTEQTSEKEEDKYTLSLGVVLAPVKYPFGLLQDLAESTLKAAKKEGAKGKNNSAYGQTFINFMTVTGSTSLDFNKVYQSLHTKKGRVDGQKTAFYATLRPYTVEDMESLLKAIREGKKKSLGRTKLHQVREAVLRMNLTTSVYEGVTVLRNWRPGQREFVTQHVYNLGNNYQEAHHDAEQPGTLFPRVTFPWFADGPDTYRTSLLDFVELYDFVAQEEVDDGH